MPSSDKTKIMTGLANMGGQIGFKPTGFRGGTKSELSLKAEKSVESTSSPVKEVASKPKSKPPQLKHKAPKALNRTANTFDRITFEITTDLRADFTGAASNLHYRSDREKRISKINRDMLMRAVLTAANELISWSEGEGVLHTEEDILSFIRDQLKWGKRSNDKG